MTEGAMPAAAAMPVIEAPEYPRSANSWAAASRIRVLRRAADRRLRVLAGAGARGVLTGISVSPALLSGHRRGAAQPDAARSSRQFGRSGRPPSPVLACSLDAPGSPLIR